MSGLQADAKAGAPVGRPTVMVCFGTRPELIKLAPVIEQVRADGRLNLVAVASGQHREMLDQMLDTFAIRPDVDLGLMRAGQSLGELASRAVAQLAGTIAEVEPAAVLVQGDTTTALCAALAAFYAGVPVGHVEAGLRTANRLDPFPEEANRRMIAPLARWHFCPTERSARSLLSEGVPAADVVLTGNTVIDALLLTARSRLDEGEQLLLPARRAPRRVLVTMHRRETQGETQRALCEALAMVANRSDVEIVMPMHLSPAVRASVLPELAQHPKASLIEPLPYRPFVHLMRSADIVLTDSGGIQEEAPSFGIPVLVMRETTERPEGVDAGCARVCGVSSAGVREELERLLDDPAAYESMARAASPYGDGRAAQRIVQRIADDLLAGARRGGAVSEAGPGGGGAADAPLPMDVAPAGSGAAVEETGAAIAATV